MGTSASFAPSRKLAACLLAALLSFALVPASALAGEDIAEPSGAEGPEGAYLSEVPTSPQPPSDPSTEADDAVSGGSSAEVGTLAASLMGRPASFVSADVALDGEPVVGSFTVDGMTFAVIDESTVELVGVSNLEMLGSTPAASEAEVDASVLTLPESVAYGDVEYNVASIGAYAFYLSGVTSVELPATIVDVDERAFRSSDVASVTVAEGNDSYSSFDGALYDAEQLSLLLIPEGKQGTVLLPQGTEVAGSGKFSHCSLVDTISVEDGAAFSSENGLLYTADLTTLLRVPAGATEITIREGCMTIAAGALEACAKLERINAPATVASISSDVFHAIPTVSLPVASSVSGEAIEGSGAWGGELVSAGETSEQLTAMVSLASAGDGLPGVQPSAILVALPDGAVSNSWQERGFSVEAAISNEASLQDASLQAASENYVTEVWDAGPCIIDGQAVTPDEGISKDAVLQGECYLVAGGKKKGQLASSPAGNAWWEITVADRDPSTLGTLRIHCDNGARITDSVIGASYHVLSSSAVPAAAWRYVGYWKRIRHAVFDHVKADYIDGWLRGRVPGDKFTKNLETVEFIGCNPASDCIRGWALFADNLSLRRLPESLTFRDNRRLVNSDYGTYGVFSNCLSLASLPEGLTFEGSSSVNASYMFKDCLSLRAVPDGFAFASMTYVKDGWRDIFGFTDSSDTFLGFNPYRYLLSSGQLVSGKYPTYYHGTDSRTKTWIVSSPHSYAGEIDLRSLIAKPTLTWDAQGGTFNASRAYDCSRISVLTGGPITLPSNPVKAGDTFLGWYDKAVGGSPIEVVDGATPSPDKTTVYYARWQSDVDYEEGAEVAFSLTYDGLDGAVFHDEEGNEVMPEEVLPSSYPCPLEEDMALPVPTRLGYAFKGWVDGSGSNVGGDAVIPSGSTGDMSFTATWEASGYVIALDAQEGTVDPSFVEAAYDADVELPAPVRYGYVFKGWDTKADGSGRRYQAGLVSKPNLSNQAGATVPLYAQWVLDVSLDVPICSPEGLSFKAALPADLDELDAEAIGGDVSKIRSFMAVPVRVERLECTRDAGSSANALASFWDSNASKVHVLLTPGKEKDSAEVVIGGSLSGSLLGPFEGIFVPAAVSSSEPGELSVRYGLRLTGLDDDFYDDLFAIPNWDDEGLFLPLAKVSFTIGYDGKPSD